MINRRKIVRIDDNQQLLYITDPSTRLTNCPSIEVVAASALGVQNGPTSVMGSRKRDAVQAAEDPNAERGEGRETDERSAGHR